MTTNTSQHEPRALPVFAGWTVDVRLRQFRRARFEREMEFVSFDSEEGDELLGRFITTINTTTAEGQDLLNQIWR